MNGDFKTRPSAHITICIRSIRRFCLSQKPWLCMLPSGGALIIAGIVRKRSSEEDAALLVRSGLLD